MWCVDMNKYDKWSCVIENSEAFVWLGEEEEEDDGEEEAAAAGAANPNPTAL